MAALCAGEMEADEGYFVRIVSGEGRIFVFFKALQSENHSFVIGFILAYRNALVEFFNFETEDNIF